ncbi:MAG: spore germination protein GerW family protein [Myxococcales bacterium]|nr:spore germination protein GerW family protein [Myxococcales bacterium]
MEQVQEIIEQVSATLADIAQSDVVVGQPMEFGEVTVVPISRVAAGFGGASGEGRGEGGSGRRGGSGTGKGTGTGGGAKVRPVAVIVFSPSGVEILPIDERQSKLERLLERIPEWVEKGSKG